MNQSNPYQDNLQLWQQYLANVRLSGDRYGEAIATTEMPLAASLLLMLPLPISHTGLTLDH